MSVTSKIAEELNISSRTVARVLIGDYKGAWPSMIKKAERIKRLAKEYGYMPSNAAKALVSKRFDRISLITGVDGPSYMPFQMFEGIESQTRESKFNLSLSGLSDKAITEGVLPNIFRELESDGALIHYRHGLPQGALENFQKNNFPFIWLNNKFENNCIYIDEFSGGKKAAEFLIGLGHKKIAYIGPLPEVQKTYCGTDRLEGYRDTMAQAGLQANEIFRDKEINMLTPEKIDFFEDLLSRGDRPTAFLCYFVYESEALLLAANRLRMRMPEDFSLFVFEDNSSSYSPYSFTHLSIPSYDLGKEGVKTLMDRISNNARTSELRLVEYGEIIHGETCRAI